MSQAAKESRAETYERHTTLPLLILALAVIPLLVVPLIFELSASAERRS